MSAIVEAMMDERSHAARMLVCGAEHEADAAYDRIERAGAAIADASQAAASANVIAGAPRTWAVRWISRSGFAIAYMDRCETTCFVTDERETYDHRSRKVFRCRPCWDATARVWRWGSPACDPRGCAWPRPWAGGEVRRG